MFSIKRKVFIFEIQRVLQMMTRNRFMKCKRAHAVFGRLLYIVQVSVKDSRTTSVKGGRHVVTTRRRFFGIFRNSANHNVGLRQLPKRASHGLFRRRNDR